MKRNPPQPPLYRAFAPGRNAYVMGYDFPKVLPEASRMWKVHSEYRSLQQFGGGYVKRLDEFDAHNGDEDTFLEFIRECSQFGTFMPSSYASVFHDRFKSPRVRWTFNSIFRPYFRGGWNEARDRGEMVGFHRAYDINSAYMWASTLGLPEVRSYEFADRLSATRPGLYVVTLRENNPFHPYPFNTETEVIASTQEIESLNLGIDQIHGGVTWSDYIPGDSCLNITKDYTFGKQMSRGYWGRWASSEKITCELASGKEWEIGNPILNYVWACLIISRVRMRLWEVSENAVHFFTDSVITRDELPTGTGLGDWRLVTDFPAGIDIRHAGFYKHLGSDSWLKHAGIPA